jgi:uncharacterized protein YecE (DUF72 family)
MAVKVSRFLTHIKRLREPEEPVSRFLGRIEGLGAKLGPVLLQLPPQFRADAGRLEATLELFPGSIRVAVEFRHRSWFVDPVRRVLERHGAALCLADGPRSRGPRWRTADWTYVRFHQGRANPPPCYGSTALATWASRLATEWGPAAEIWVYFNNDPRGCAPRNAAQFAGLCRRAGLDPTRVPTVRSVPVRTGT